MPGRWSWRHGKATATGVQGSQSGASTSGVPAARYAIPADRLTTWQPGVTYNGGIPARATIFTTLTPSGGDDTATIQAAITSCPAGQTVALAAGTFLINDTSPVALKSGVTLRGAGLGITILSRTANGHAIFDTNINGLELLNASGNGTISAYAPVVGTAAKGATSVTISGANAATLFTNWTTIKYVLVDHVSAATNVADPQNFAHGGGTPTGSVLGGVSNPDHVWRSPDAEIFWPDRESTGALPWYVGVYFRRNATTDGDDARPQGEFHQISGMTDLGGGSYQVTFTSPLHHAFSATRLAQVAWFDTAWLEGVGVEDLTLRGGGRGNVRFQQCAKSWLARVESAEYKDPSLFVYAGFQCEIRDAYIHDAWYPYNGGGGYATAFDYYTSEQLLENSIIVRTAKPMVFRSSGAGSVVGYCHVDAQFDGGNGATWQEVGPNGSHMVGGYMILFEGNWGCVYDSDKRWGGSTRMMVFRNYLRGRNELTYTWAGTTFTEASSAVGPKRCAGAQAWSYWQTFVGNVLGKSGQHTGWAYETAVGIFESGIWSLGWDDVSPYGGNANDPQVTATALRDGNYDYLTDAVHWHGIGGSGSGNGLAMPAVATLPDSLYLSGKPSWFGSLPWPWVDAAGATKTATLPAKAWLETLEGSGGGGSSASDTFNRANGGLGTDWTDLHGGLVVASNACVATQAGANNSAYYHALTPNADHYAEVVIVTDGNGGPIARASAGPNFYLWNVRESGCSMQKCVAGSFSTIPGSGASGVTLGSAARIEVEGTTLRGYYNGVLLVTVTDADLATGFGGIYNFDTAGSFDDFTVGNL